MNSGSPPIIGITTYGRNAEGDFRLPAGYVDTVRAAGGIPFLLPPGEMRITQILEIVDGVLLAGGGDLDPKLYGGNHHPTIERINPERDSFEILLAKSLLTNELPVLGVCRGMQILNVASGGTLVEDVPERFGTSVVHRGSEREPVPHMVKISGKSMLGQLTGSEEFPVMSLHHQGLATIPPPWVVTATSADNVVEAIERPGHPFMVAVLWHPELSPEQEEQRALLGAFMDAAVKYRSTKKRN